MDRRYDIRTSKPFPAAIEVTFKIVVQVKRMAAHKRQDSADRPTLTEFFESVYFRKIVHRGHNESIAHIEVRRPFIAARVGTVIRLRSVRNKILAVARRINRMRPSVRDLIVEAVPIALCERYLKRVVIRIRTGLDFIHVERVVGRERAQYSGRIERPGYGAYAIASEV